MLQLVGVLVTAAVTLVSTLSWPTLRRRLREHASLLKDLPDGDELAAPLRALVAQEVKELAARERQRLDPVMRRVLALQRVLVTYWVAAVAAGVPLLTAWMTQPSEDVPPVAWIIAISLFAVSVIAAAVLAVAVPRLRTDVKKRVRTRRRQRLGLSAAARSHREPS